MGHCYGHENQLDKGPLLASLITGGRHALLNGILGKEKDSSVDTKKDGAYVEKMKARNWRQTARIGRPGMYSACGRISTTSTAPH